MSGTDRSPQIEPTHVWSVLFSKDAEAAHLGKGHLFNKCITIFMLFFVADTVFIPVGLFCCWPLIDKS